MDRAEGDSSRDGDRRLTSDAAATKAPMTMANVAAWLLVAAFVGLVLSVVVPAMGDGARSDWAAALLFMFGMTATLVGSGMALAASVVKARAVLGGLLMLVGLVLMYGIVPALAALGVVLIGVATQLSSLPGD